MKKRKNRKNISNIGKITDPLGSWTGTAQIGSNTPEQDVDDL